MVFFKNTCRAFFLIFIIWFIGYAGFLASILSMKPERGDEITDAIIVLTGGQMRIETGLELFADGRSGHLFITGVHPGVGKRDITQKWKRDTALPPCCITLGHSANTTVENANETKSWIADKSYSSIRLITANFHMNRAMIEFKNLLPDVEIIRHPIVQPNTTFAKLYFWELSVIEYHKTLFRWVSLFLQKGVVS